MMAAYFRQFGVLFDRYFWQTAVLIARNGLARQYRNSFLGMFWTLLQPLMMVIIYSCVMPMIMRFSAPNYPLYIIVSLPLWAFFSSCFIGASTSILANGETLKRCMISSTVFPIADVLRNTYTFCISFFVMYLIATSTLSSFSPIILLLPLYFIPVLMIVGSIAIAIAFIAPYVRDVGEMIVVSMNMLFWTTPIVYQIGILPMWAQEAMRWNPFYIMLHPLQVIAYEHALPGAEDVLRLLALTLVAILTGVTIYRLCRRNYVYYL